MTTIFTEGTHVFEKFRNLAAGTAIAVAAMLPAQAATVDTVLSLVIDTSGSVDSTEYALQRTGYVNAFNDAAIIAAITDTTGGKVGAIAVNVIQFASNASQAIAMTIIDSAASAQAFAAALNSMARIESGLTAIGRGIDAGEQSIADWLLAGNSATRKVIDVSGDGSNNSGIDPLTASASFCGAGGGTINGISIGNDALKTYYQDNVRCGGGFVLSASSFADFDNAIRTKLKAEITGTDPGASPIPLPAAGWLMIAGIGALAAARRRKA